MRRTALTMLIPALAIMAGACSDSGPDIHMATIDQMRVVKVSGDQSTPAAALSSPPASPGLSLAVQASAAYTEEPLVGQVVAEVQGRGTGMSGPSSELVVPRGTLIHWELPTEAGRLLGSPTATDDSAYFVNRWAPGTRAGTYAARAQTLRPTGEIVTEETWELTVVPGPLHSVARNSITGLVYEGDTIDVAALVRHGLDAHGNEIPAAEVIAFGEPEWEVYIMGELTSIPDFPREDVLVGSGTGWNVTAPEWRESPGFPFTYIIQMDLHGVTFRFYINHLRQLPTVPEQP